MLRFGTITDRKGGETVRRILLIVCLVLILGAALPASGAPAQGDDKWALIIGIDEYQKPTRPTVGGVGDARAFQQLLSRNGWRPDRVRVLTNADATASAIRAGMQWLVDNCGPSSYCVFHYSGHTKQMNNAGGNEGLREYLWSVDNQFISDEEFAGYMRRLNSYAWIDISACEAAGFDNGVSSPRRLFTAASQESEKGFEDPSWRQSIWTGLLVDRGMLQGQADANGDGNVSLAEAIPFATQRAPLETSGQSPGPQHPYAAGGQETQWFEPAPPPAAAPKSCLLGLLCL